MLRSLGGGGVGVGESCKDRRIKWEHGLLLTKMTLHSAPWTSVLRHALAGSFTSITLTTGIKYTR